MSRSLAIVAFLTFMTISFQIGDVNCFLCERFRKSMDWIISIFSLKKVNFYLYTSAYENPQKISCLYGCDFRNVKFDPNLRTTVIIHGFLNDYKTDWIQSLIHQLFLWQHMNVIVVDWSEIFNVNYYQTAKRVVNVAIQTNEFLQQLARKSKKNLRDWPYLHIMGHSLGAHVAGQTAEMLKTNIFVHRVTAFDPAKPYFDSEGAELKLNKWAAQFVDVIHTNSARQQETFGLFEPLGHVDFYPNGGDRQPKCNRGKVGGRFLQTFGCLSEVFFGMDLVSLKQNFLSRMIRGDDMICDHGEGQKYFIDSINSVSTFFARKVASVPESASTNCVAENCNGRDCIKMGMHSIQYNNPQYHGVYYVNTQCHS